MTRVFWTPQALEDVEAIRDYIARDSAKAAEHTVLRIVQLADAIQDFPLAGRVVPEIGIDELRERLLGNYRVVYRLREDTAQILTVHHAARRFELPDEPRPDV